MTTLQSRLLCPSLLPFVETRAGALEPRHKRRTCAANTSLPSQKWPGGDGVCPEPHSLKAVAVVLWRLLNSPASFGNPAKGGERKKPRQHIAMQDSFSPSALASPDAIRWYYTHDGQVVGPMPFAALEALWKAGQFAPGVLVAREGTEEWQPLSEVLPPDTTVASLPPIPQQQSDNAPASQKEKWYEHPFVVFPILVFCFPVGLLILWKSRHFSRFQRIGWTAVVALIFAAVQMSDQDSTPSRSSEKVDSDTGGPKARNIPDASSPASGLGESDKAAMKAELMKLFEELESFRMQESFHLRGFARTGKADWRARVKAIGEQATAKAGSAFNPITGAAGVLDGMGMGYLNSKGMVTDSIRLSWETLADQLEAPEIFELRWKSDFDFILDGLTQTFFNEVMVVNIADMIEAAKANRVPWHIAERWLFVGNNIYARLVRFDEKHLFYESKTSRGSPLVFGLKRTEAIEKRFAKDYPQPETLYKELMAGRSLELDPLRFAYVIVTSGYEWEEDQLEKETMLVRVIHLMD